MLTVAAGKDDFSLCAKPSIAGYFVGKPLLAPPVGRETDDRLDFSNDVDIVVAANSFRAVRGRTIACVVFDETAF